MKNIIALTLILLLPSASDQIKADVFFAFDRYDLEPAQQQKLDQLLANNPTLVVSTIYGYCDRTGASAYNDSLSLRRARHVAEYLKLRDTKFSEGFEIKGFGEDISEPRKPAASRRVEVGYTVGKLEVKEPSELQAKVEKMAVGEKIRLKNLNFYNLSDQFVPKSRPVLQELLKLLQDKPNLKIQIQGHICCQTVRQADYSYVSTTRAKAVYDYLVKNGIDKERLSYKGFGVTRPLYPIPEKSDFEADENRRVEIEVISN